MPRPKQVMKLRFGRVLQKQKKRERRRGLAVLDRNRRSYQGIKSSRKEYIRCIAHKLVNHPVQWQMVLVRDSMAMKGRDAVMPHVRGHEDVCLVN